MSATRRQALAGLAIAPLAITVPAAALARGADRAHWNVAMARYERVKAEADSVYQRWEAAEKSYIAITGREPSGNDFVRYGLDEHVGRLTGYTALNDRVDECGDAVSDAESVLMQTPAPDAEAVLWKIDRLFGEDACSGDSLPCWSTDYTAQTFADIRRLLTNGRA